MFPPRTIRSIVTCVLACGLLAITTSSAVARPADDARYAAPTSSLAGTTSKTPAACSPNLPDAASMACLEALTTPRQDLRSPDARDAANAEFIARQMEQYYERLGTREPVAQPAVAAPADDSPWLLVSVFAGGLALALASVALMYRRRHTTRVA